MKNRKEINHKLIEWIKNKVRTEYAEDISFVLIYGSYINGTANSKSDVDCYFIPKTERGFQFANTFIIDGVGYDIFPMDWERVERIANLEECMAPLVGDVEVIYYKDSNELNRFVNLQEKLKQNLSNKEYVEKIARVRCEEASELCARIKAGRSAEEIRKWSGMAIMALADVAAVYNQDYFHFGLKKQFEDLKDNFPNVPRSIVNAYQNAVEADDEKAAAYYALKMFDEVCEYIGVTLEEKKIVWEESAEAGEINGEWLAGLYQEISSTFNKIYICCENENDVLAFLSAVCLQRDLDEAKEAGYPQYDLLSGYHYMKLDELYKMTKNIEDDLVRLIVENGGCIKKYDSFEEFEICMINR